MTITDHWMSGIEEFNTKRINYFKNHLKEGGEIWICADEADNRSAAAIRQGPNEHQRTQKEGCILSVTATGEGDMDLISQLNREPQVFLSRTGEPHETLLTAKQYKYVRKGNEVSVADPIVPSRTVRNVADVAKGSSWFGVLTFYFMRIPGRTTVKIPCLFLILSLTSRAVGIGATTPICDVLRGGWIVLRLIINVITDSNDAMGGWFWAFLVSLIWPLCSMVKHVWKNWLSKREETRTPRLLKMKTMLRPPTLSPHLKDHVHQLLQDH